MSLCLKLGKRMKRKGQLSVTMPLEENRRLGGFLHSNVGKKFKISTFCSSATGRTDENVEKGNKIIKEGRRSTISEIAGNLGLLHRTCQRILREHAADLCEVCVSVAHRRAAREAIFGRCKHGCIILTRVIWPLVMSSFLGIKSQLRRHLF
jgi:hypothetical protein